jgi:hypothetical protein
MSSGPGPPVQLIELHRRHAEGAGETTDDWYSRATTACSPFIFPESRFRMRWPGDDLVGPLENARHWVDTNPCPDDAIDTHLRTMLDAYAEMQGATVGHMMELRDQIEQHAQAIDRRRTPRDG